MDETGIYITPGLIGMIQNYVRLVAETRKYNDLDGDGT